MKRAIIVGVCGQDGRLLCKMLLENNYSIIGVDRINMRFPAGISCKHTDIYKYSRVADLVKEFMPHEIYYLAAYHHSSENLPADNIKLMEESYKAHVTGLVNFLEAIRKISQKTRIFYAASSYIFGAAKSRIQDEKTSVNPSCIYGITKAAGLHLCRFYRSRYGIFAAVGILYNHESVFRSANFVSKKIIEGAVNINKGIMKELVLGDLRAVADWGYAPDYVRAMRLILNNSVPDDFIVATGKGHTVLDFVREVFQNMEMDWKAYIKESPSIVRKQNFYRVGDPGKLKRVTGWKPSVDFKGMIKALLYEEGVLDEKK